MKIYEDPTCICFQNDLGTLINTEIWHNFYLSKIYDQYNNISMQSAVMDACQEENIILILDTISYAFKFKSKEDKLRFCIRYG